jgi:hypothetical protein
VESLPFVLGGRILGELLACSDTVGDFRYYGVLSLYLFRAQRKMVGVLCEDEVCHFDARVVCSFGAPQVLQSFVFCDSHTSI